MFGEYRKVRGMISGMPIGEKLVELKKNIKGGSVTEIKRLKSMRDGEKVDLQINLFTENEPGVWTQ